MQKTADSYESAVLAGAVGFEPTAKELTQRAFTRANNAKNASHTRMTLVLDMKNA